MTISFHCIAHFGQRDCTFIASAHCRDNLWHEVAEKINEIERETRDKVDALVIYKEDVFE